MKGEPARRTGVYLGVHQGDEYKYLSTGSTQQKTDYGGLERGLILRNRYHPSVSYRMLAVLNNEPNRRSLM
ncbi:MAG: hypothetical protein LBJ92_02790 [Holosporales bacterium]|nr:hypothetical protein [Holosporales bacterium]